MNRYTVKNTEGPHETMCFDLAPSEANEWKKTGVNDVPPGWRPFVRFEGNTLKFGVEPDVKAAPPQDKLDSMDTPTLHTLAGRHGIEYTANTPRSELVKKLRNVKK